MVPSVRVPDLVVLPTYNEAENVIGVAEDVLAIDGSLEILVVDDASPDGTGELVAEAARRQPRLHLLRRPGKLGLGTAYLAGFRHGLEHGYERILTIRDDDDHARLSPGRCVEKPSRVPTAGVFEHPAVGAVAQAHRRVGRANLGKRCCGIDREPSSSITLSLSDRNLGTIEVVVERGSARNRIRD